MKFLFKKNILCLFIPQYAGRGFTIVEVIVVVSLNTMLLMVITFTITQLYKSNSYTFEQSNEIEVARRGLYTWVRDAREMTFGGNGNYPLVKVGTSTIGFYGDIDKDNSVEYVEYILSSTTLIKRTFNPSGYPITYNTTVPDNTEILSEYIQNNQQSLPIFRYYDSNGSVISSPSSMISDITYITMNIIVNIDPLRSPGEFMLQGSAAPRNIKTNL